MKNNFKLLTIQFIRFVVRNKLYWVSDPSHMKLFDYIYLVKKECCIYLLVTFCMVYFCRGVRSGEVNLDKLHVPSWHIQQRPPGPFAAGEEDGSSGDEQGFVEGERSEPYAHRRGHTGLWRRRRQLQLLAACHQLHRVQVCLHILLRGFSLLRAAVYVAALNVRDHNVRFPGNQYQKVLKKALLEWPIIHTDSIYPILVDTVLLFKLLTVSCQFLIMSLFFKKLRRNKELSHNKQR